MVLVVLLALIPLRMLLHGLELKVSFENTAEALYRDDVGGELAFESAIAVVAMAVGSLVIWRMPSRSLADVVAASAVTIALGLGITAVAHLKAADALNPFGPETSALDAFTPPSGARLSSDAKLASDAPTVTRSWLVPGPMDAVCRQAEDAFRVWIGPSADVRRPFPCYLEASRGEEKARLSVVTPTSRPGEILVGLTVQRA